MNTILRKLLVTLSASIALLLVSCIDVEQEFWIHADGSGRIKVTNKIPTEMVEGIREIQVELARALGAEVDKADPYGLLQQKDELKESKNVKSVKVSHSTEGEFTCFTYDIQARDMTKAHEILAVLYANMEDEAPKENSPVDMERIATGVRITKLRGGSYRFFVDLAEGEKARIDDPAGELAHEITKGLFLDTGITFRVHGASVKSADDKASRAVEEWTAKFADLAANQVPTVDAEVTGFRGTPRASRLLPSSDAGRELELEDTQGRTIQASILQITETSVRIRKTGSAKEYTIPRSRLSSRSNGEIEALEGTTLKRR